MFDKIKFAQILKQISETYDNQREFSKKSGINRTYISQYMNMKLEEPPKPKILQKLANSSHGITNYDELMKVCGYTNHSLEVALFNELRNELEEQFLDRLSSIHLSKKEYEVYETLEDIYIHSNELNMTQQEISKKISSYFEPIDWISEKSKDKIRRKLNIFIEYCNIPIKMSKYDSEKYSYENNSKFKKNSDFQFYMCPVYGQISAGQPNWAEECIEGRLPIDPNMMNIVDPEECFFLRVNGESMNKLVRNGAYALIRKADWVENGEIAVVLVNGFDATLKKFSKQGDLVVLEPMSNDNSFQVQIYDKNTPIKILGKYIGKFEMK